jgi:hypothetical protein
MRVPALYRAPSAFEKRSPRPRAGENTAAGWGGKRRLGQAAAAVLGTSATADSLICQSRMKDVLF